MCVCVRVCLLNLCNVERATKAVEGVNNQMKRFLSGTPVSSPLAVRAVSSKSAVLGSTSPASHRSEKKKKQTTRLVAEPVRSGSVGSSASLSEAMTPVTAKGSVQSVHSSTASQASGLDKPPVLEASASKSSANASPAEVCISLCACMHECS